MEEDNDFHLLGINDTLGCLPSFILSEWPRSAMYFRSNGVRHLEEKPVVVDSLEIAFAANKPDDVDDEEAKVISALIHHVLKYDPKERSSAAEILEHPWFQN